MISTIRDEEQETEKPLPPQTIQSYPNSGESHMSRAKATSTEAITSGNEAPESISMLLNQYLVRTHLTSVFFKDKMGNEERSLLLLMRLRWTITNALCPEMAICLLSSQ